MHRLLREGSVLMLRSIGSFVGAVLLLQAEVPREGEEWQKPYPAPHTRHFLPAIIS